MTDYIKRDIERIIANAQECDIDALTWEEQKERLKAVKSADVAPVRHGHWIYDCCDIVCSECGTRYNDELCYMLRSDCSYHEPRYCLWCGARMDGESDE